MMGKQPLRSGAVVYSCRFYPPPPPWPSGVENRLKQQARDGKIEDGGPGGQWADNGRIKSGLRVSVIDWDSRRGTGKREDGEPGGQWADNGRAIRPFRVAEKPLPAPGRRRTKRAAKKRKIWPFGLKNRLQTGGGRPDAVFRVQYKPLPPARRRSRRLWPANEARREETKNLAFWS